MKLSALILAAGLVGATAVEATPYYVGENLTPNNNVTLGFADAPTKDLGNDKGNIATIEIEGVYNIIPDLALELNLPLSMVSKSATSATAGAGTSRTSLGNIGTGVNWSRVLSDSSENVQWGIAAAFDLYLPTSRKVEAANVWAANPTTEFFRYATKTTSAHPHAGLFLNVDQFKAKANAGYGYSYVAGTGITDRNRNNFTGQTAISWTPMEVLALNLEYNAIVFDTETTSGGKRYRHALTPSVSGNYGNILGSAFTVIPLDSTTRDYSAVAFGLNAGYMF